MAEVVVAAPVVQPMIVTAVAQPAVVMQPMMMMQGGMPGMQMPGMAPQQQEMKNEFSYLDFNQMKSLVLNTEDGTKILYEMNPNCEDLCKAKVLCLLTCGMCDIKEFKFKGPDTQVTYEKPQGCCTKWQTKLNSSGTVGKVEKTGCCPTCDCKGFFFCWAKYLMCWGTDKYLEFRRVGGRANGEEAFTLRKKLFPMWCCTDILCNQLACVVGPCSDVLSKMFACCKFCQNQEYLSLKQPIYGPWGTGNEPIGSVTNVKRAVPFTPCCAEFEPVRVSMEVPGDSKTGDVANLGFLALVYSDRIPADFQTPKGNCCLDCGLSVETKWQNFEDMVNMASATSQANSPASSPKVKK